MREISSGPLGPASCHTHASDGDEAVAAALWCSDLVPCQGLGRWGGVLMDSKSIQEREKEAREEEEGRREKGRRFWLEP